MQFIKNFTSTKNFVLVFSVKYSIIVKSQKNARCSPE